jgi:hypothetical protein
MALDNLANLFSSMQQWAVDRPDLVPYFQDCVDMAINDINRVLRLRQQQQEIVLTLDAASSAPLPDDYLEWRQVRYLGSPEVNLEPLTPEGSSDEYAYPSGGTPDKFRIDDATLTVFPAASGSTVNLKYWAKVPYLRSTPPADTNWLLKLNANLIFYGAMKHVEVFKRNDKGMQTFGSLYSGLIDGMVREGKRSQWSRTRMRVAGRSTP